jgi:hypothetical protein
LDGWIVSTIRNWNDWLLSRLKDISKVKQTLETQHLLRRNQVKSSRGINTNKQVKWILAKNYHLARIRVVLLMMHTP